MSDTNTPAEGDPPVVASDTTAASADPAPTEGEQGIEGLADEPGAPQAEPTADPTDDSVRPWHNSADPWEAMYQFVVGELAALKAKLGV